MKATIRSLAGKYLCVERQGRPVAEGIVHVCPCGCGRTDVGNQRVFDGMAIQTFDVAVHGDDGDESQHFVIQIGG